MASEPVTLAARPGRWRSLVEHDLIWSLKRHPVAMISLVVLVVVAITAALAPVIAPQNPFDLRQLDLMNSDLPPIWATGGEWPFILGTDPQGRDILSAILYGSRVSLLIGVASVLLAMSVGVTIGLVAGFFGGIVDNILMRIGDTLLSLPTILVAILITAVGRELLPPAYREAGAAGILILAIAITNWVQYARTVRAQTMVERGKEYVLAARLLRVPAWRIMLGHIMPNTMTPVLVTATLSLGLAILIEATLSFLGVGMPVTQPSLGTLIRIGNQYLFSGSWWVIVFPSLALGLIVLAVNLLGDWLRDALNPKLR